MLHHAANRPSGSGVPACLGAHSRAWRIVRALPAKTDVLGWTMANQTCVAGSDAVVSARVAMTLWQGDCGYRYRNPAAGGLEVDGSDWVASEAGRGRIGPGVRRLRAFGIRALGTRLRSAIVGHRRKRAPAFRRRAGNKKPPTRRGSVWTGSPSHNANNILICASFYRFVFSSYRQSYRHRNVAWTVKPVPRAGGNPRSGQLAGTQFSPWPSVPDGHRVMVSYVTIWT